MEQKIGDIIIFEADDSWVSKCIAILTKSNVSHSAIVYSEQKMAEVGGRGISVNGYREDPAGEVVHLLRHTHGKDGAPLAEAARRYVEAKIKYDYPAMVLLGGLLLYRLVRPTPRWQKITDLVLNAACAALDKLLIQFMHCEGSMICSQLVYQCCLDCGEEYRLRLRSADQMVAAPMEGICLAQLAEEFKPDSAALPLLAYAPVTEADTESVARELYGALEAAEATESDMLLSPEALSSTTAAAARFLDLMERILEQAHIDLPVYAAFVTPSDILNAENLEEYGTIKIERMQG